MHRQIPVPIVEYLLASVVLLLIGMAVLQWILPLIPSLPMYPMSRPMGILSLCSASRVCPY
jgi:hypothetical protein